jgi:hypothetical protein
MIYALIALFVAAVIFSFLWLDTREALAAADRRILQLKAGNDILRAQLAASDEIRHSVANSALRGCPAVKWHRPYPVPAGADAWYWRAMFAGEPHLFTDEALREARQRAVHLLPSGLSVPSATPPTPCATS